MGVALIVTPSIFLTSMFAQTLFPALTHVQDDKERINRILIEVSSWVILLGLPGVAVICLWGHSAALRCVWSAVCRRLPDH